MNIVSLLWKEALEELSLYIKDERNKLCHITLGTIQKRFTEKNFRTKIREIKNKLTEEGYGEDHLQSAKKRINLYSRKRSRCPQTIRGSNLTFRDFY